MNPNRRLLNPHTGRPPGRPDPEPTRRPATLVTVPNAWHGWIGIIIDTPHPRTLAAELAAWHRRHPHASPLAAPAVHGRTVLEVATTPATDTPHRRAVRWRIHCHRQAVTVYTVLHGPLGARHEHRLGDIAYR